MNYYKKQRYIRMFQDNMSVTNVFLVIQLMVYLLMTLMGGSENPYVLLMFGAKVNGLVAMGEYWRLVTPIFVHIGIAHIVMNSLFLYYLGNEIERILGSWRFLIVYLLSGIMGNVCSFAFSKALSAGASTSLFGLFGAILYLAYKHSYIRSFDYLGKTYGTLIIVNIVFGFLNSGVDNFGHLGGLLGGFLITSVVSFRGDRNTKLTERILAIMIYVIVFIVLFRLGMSKVLY